MAAYIGAAGAAVVNAALRAVTRRACRRCLRALRGGATRSAELVVGVFGDDDTVLSDANVRLDRAAARIALEAVIAECDRRGRRRSKR